MNADFFLLLTHIGFIISSWVLILLLTILVYLSFNPWGKLFVEAGSSEGVEPGLSRAWKHRCTSILCYDWFKSKTDREGLRHIGGKCEKW